MKKINHKTISVSLLAFFLLVSFTLPLKETKEIEGNSNDTYLPSDDVGVNPVSASLLHNLVDSLKTRTGVSNDASTIQNVLSNSHPVTIAQVESAIEDNNRLIEYIQPITPLPVRPILLNSKNVLLNLSNKLASNSQKKTSTTEREFYKYDSTSKSFGKVIDKNLNSPLWVGGFDPVRLTLSSDKETVNIGEEVEIKITAEYLDVSHRLIFQFEGSNGFTLKMLLPEGFVQTGGTYYDFVQGKVTKEAPKLEFTIKGFLEEQQREEACFSLLRSFAGAGVNDVWEKKANKCLSFNMRKPSRNLNNSRTKAINVVNPYNNLSAMKNLCDDCTITSPTQTNLPVSVNSVMPNEPLVINGLWGCMPAVADTKWFYFTARKNGDIKIKISVNVNFLDYITFGPFNSIEDAQNKTKYSDLNYPCTHNGECGGDNLCNFQRSNDLTRDVTFRGAVAGQVYTICVSHYTPLSEYTISAYDISQICNSPVLSINQVGNNLILNGCTDGTVIWQKNGVNVPNTNVSEGVYTATCTVSQCISASASFTVGPNSCPASVPTISANGLQLTAIGSCPGGEYKWYKNHNIPITPSSQSITGEFGQTYQVLCSISETCESGISEEVTLSNCNVTMPTVEGPSTITIPADQTTTLLTTYSSCIFEGVKGTFEWYKDGAFYSDQSQISAGVGCYKLRCRINDDCYSTFTSPVCVKNNNCGDFTLFAYSNATTRQCGVSVGESLILYGGIENGISYNAIEWKFNGVLIPNSNSGAFMVKQHATDADNGTYTLRVQKNGVWCETSFNINICPCSFSALPMFTSTGNPTSGTTTFFSSNNCPTCNHTWTLPTDPPTTRNVSSFTLTNGERMNGTFTLSVTNSDGCTSGGSIYVNGDLQANYSSNISNAFCDNVSGWIQDSNNPGRQIGPLTLEYKNITTNANTVSVNVNVTNYGYFNYPWTLPANNDVYEVKVKDPSNNYIGPYQTSPALIQCCALALNPNLQPETVCNTGTRLGRYVVYLTGHSTTQILQYRLSKKSYNSEGFGVYSPVNTTWTTIPVGTAVPFIQLVNLERGFYRLEVVEGASTTNQGCKILTEFVINCEPPVSAQCGNAPLISVLPEGTIIEGSGVTPTLYAEPIAIKSNTSVGLGKVAFLSGNNSIQVGNQDGTQSNTFEAWIKAENNSDITVGYIGAGEKHRALMKYWGVQNPFSNTLSVGSNGVTLIEDIPNKQNARRIAVSFNRKMTGWNHIALVYRNHIPEIYINGKLEGKATQSIYTIQNVQVASSYNTQIGYNQNLGFIGSIDEIRLWFSTLGSTPDLTAATISENLKSRDNIPTITTGKYWAFEEADPLKNVSGSNFDKLKFEGTVQVRTTTTADDHLPQNQDYKWYLDGTYLATKSSYTTLIDQLKPVSQTYVLHYTGDNGVECQTSKTINVQRCISISPNTTQQVCEGAAVTLTATGTTGSTFTWYKVGKTTALATNTATFAVPSSAEGDGIYYAVSSACGAGNAESDKVEIKHAVIAKPKASALPNPATESTPNNNTNVNLKGSYIGDNEATPTYTWKGPNNFVSSLQNPVLQNVTRATHAGIYTLTLTQGTNNLTCTSTATVKLLINAVNCGLTFGTEQECSGSLGKITVRVSGNTIGRNLEYSLDNSSWQTSNEFSNLFSGDYDVYVRSYPSGTTPDQLTDVDYCYVSSQQVIVKCTSECVSSKKLNYDRWDNIGGTEIADFSATQLANIFNSPKSLSAFAPNGGNEPNFEIHNITTPNFITRIHGKICFPVAGTYTFYMKADNSAKLYLNLSGSLQEIIWVPDNPNNHNQEVSGQVTITQPQVGTLIPIEVHHKQGISSSFIILSWKFGNNPKVLVSADYLSPTNPNLPTPCPTFTLTTTPGKIPSTIMEGTEIKAIATATTGNTSDFKWWADGSPNTDIFSIPKGMNEHLVENTATNVPVYIRPTKTNTTQPNEPQEKVYKVAYVGKEECYQTIKLKVIAQTCDCPLGDCDNIALENPAVIGASNFDNGKNYIAETVYLNETATEGKQTITYYDGLGRSIQKIGLQAGPERQDMVQPIIYDAVGRMPKNYLAYPVMNNIGKFVANASTNTESWYNSNKSSNKPFTETTFEPSPLTRPTAVASVGNNIASIVQNTSMVYGTNAGDIKKFIVAGSTVTRTTYAANTLYKIASTETAEDNDGNANTFIVLTTIEYKDIQGRVVCKEVGGLRTYNVYNDLGQLVCVVPPKAELIAPASFKIFPTAPQDYIPSFHELIFQYAYNERELLIKKKVPSAAMVEMAYYDTAPHNDLLKETKEYRNDQLVSTEMIYDNFHRPTLTKVDGLEVSKTYYDTYSTLEHDGYKLSKGIGGVPNFSPHDIDETNLKGMVVGSWTAQYGDTPILPTTLYYDKKHRLVQTATLNHTSFGTQVVDYTTNALDFIGRILATYTEITHNLGGGSLKTITKMGYDPGGRNTAICQKIDKNEYSEKWQPVARYNYNDIGEMTQKILGCRTQVVDYKYNVRGWLEKINDQNNLKVMATKEYDFFGMELRYTGDGNIINQYYKNAIRSGNTYDADYDITQTNLHTYAFTYDNQKRLLTGELTGGIKDFKLTMGAYDANGNISTLQRRFGSSTLVDNLTYNYDGNNPNRINDIADASNNAQLAKTGSYLYYPDGSIKTDGGKNITFTYAPNALPLTITGAKSYQYTYKATGGKLSTKDANNKIYDYIGNAVYKSDADGGGNRINTKLEFIGTPEGRWIPKEQLKAYAADKAETTAIPAKYGRFEYMLKDHLGNSRVACRCVEKLTATTTADQTYLPVETQINHYDPWGVSLNDDLAPITPNPPPIPSIKTPINRFTYNGKELQTDIGLFEYGFRWYDPNIARFISVDPLAEDYAYKTPYDYAENEPISNIDLDGLESWKTIDGRLISGPFSQKTIKDNHLQRVDLSISQNTENNQSQSSALDNIKTYANNVGLGADAFETMAERFKDSYKIGQNNKFYVKNFFGNQYTKVKSLEGITDFPGRVGLLADGTVLFLDAVQLIKNRDKLSIADTDGLITGTIKDAGIVGIGSRSTMGGFILGFFDWYSETPAGKRAKIEADWENYRKAIKQYGYGSPRVPARPPELKHFAATTENDESVNRPSFNPSKKQ